VLSTRFYTHPSPFCSVESKLTRDFEAQCSLFTYIACVFDFYCIDPVLLTVLAVVIVQINCCMINCSSISTYFVKYVHLCLSPICLVNWDVRDTGGETQNNVRVQMHWAEAFKCELNLYQLLYILLFYTRSFLLTNSPTLPDVHDTLGWGYYLICNLCAWLYQGKHVMWL